MKSSYQHTRNSKHTALRAAIESLEARTLLSTYVVNTISDAAAPGPGNLTLRQAIANANSHSGPDTITFSTTVFKPGSLHTITLTRGQLQLTDKSGATTISGPGSAVLAISGAGASRVFNVAAGVSATISGLAVTNGQAPVDSLSTARGGGIFNAGTLNLSAVNVSQNSAKGSTESRVGQPYSYAYGGGIYSTGPLHLQNSTVSGNSAVGGNGDGASHPVYPAQMPAGGWALGGGIWCGAALIISASTVSNNQAIGGYSGFWQFDDGPDNGGSAVGGGIACSELTLTNSTVAGNKALGSSLPDGSGNHNGRGGSGSGGGISASGVVTISNSTLSGNQAIGADFRGDDRAYAGNAAGGALWGGASITIQSSTITQNQAIGGDNTAFGYGGGASGGGVFSVGALSANCSTISKNAATAGQGFSLAVPAPANGGGIYCGSLLLTQCTVIGNTATSADVFDGGGLGASGGGGAFVWGAATIVQSTVSGNTVSGNAYGAASSSVGGGLEVQGSLTLSSSTVSGNRAAGSGNAYGGAYGQGGGIWCSGNSLVATNSTIANNSASGGNYHSESASAGPTTGGGIAASGNAKLYNCTVVGNTVSSTSGAPGWGGGLFVNSPALLNNSILSVNKANGGFNDTYGPILKTSANNLIGVGGSLTNGVNGNKVGVTNPKLSPLANYGGPTQTMLPMAGSSAIDAGSNAVIPSGVTTDQRGMPRIFGKSVDMGADEYISLTLTGNVFNDKNGDGIRQSADPGLANWQVYIDLNNIGYIVAGDPVATTNSLGNYTLTYLPTSTKPLIVREVRQNNWRRTKPAGIYPLGYYTVSPTAGSVAKLDFGNSATSLVTGTVFKDANANGKLDAGEAGLSGWTVKVDYLSSSGWQNNKFTVATDAKGSYSFVLAAGTYRIHEVVKAGFTPTKPLAAGYNVTLATGATLTGENFGNK